MENVNNNFIQINEEIIKKAKHCTSPEALQTLLKENGLDISEEQAKDIFNNLHDTNRELSDDELDVVGGGCGSPKRSGVRCLNCKSTDTKKWMKIDDITWYKCNHCKVFFEEKKW